ncbi:GLIPR1-like protein 1 [Trematomus bernacchii]|uniref:GLIPR1-like protein 1 n=1 Tax=Trematomus bernacchii TaxID=40690 RepID=UPI00146CDE1B|nr:GLIPR1-like protein 1 [Trematomus bernacchii]
MASVVQIFLWAWIIKHSRVCSDSLPENTSKRFVIECLEEHNRARSSVNPPARDMLFMTWDEGLAITAAAWARNCLFVHNVHLEDVRRVHPTFSSVGENLWAGFPASHFNVTRAIKSWVDEVHKYDFDQNRCSGVCGHYTQVVWASSYKVGCAVQLCPNGVERTSFASREGAIFVCNYATGGNLNGRKPYSPGSGCSGCIGTCVDNLCRSPDRDKQKSYGWTPDWDPALSKRGYVPGLIVRPLALVFTFIAAFAVHHFYPNVFFYE